MSSEEEDELETVEPSTYSVIDDAELHEGLRAHFPLSFGKQETKQTPLESVHSKTKREADPKLARKPLANGLQAKSTSLKERFVSVRDDRPNKFADAKADKDKADSTLIHTTQKFRQEPAAQDDDVGFVGPLLTRPHGDQGFVGPTLPSQIVVNDNDGFPGSPPPYEQGIIGPTLPPSTGQELEEEMIGPLRPEQVDRSIESSDENEDDEDDEEEEGTYAFPVSNEIVLTGHTKVVSALAVDATGSRVLTGSYDYSVRMYDFQGMDARLRSFRQMEPFEGHQVRSLSWSPTADRFLCVTGSAQAKIYDRDGVTLGEFLKGDMYIRDLKNTKGHISGLTAGEWHPKEKQLILTSSEDGSLRIWDVNDFKSQKQVIKPRLARPGRVAVTACTWGLDGKCLAGGLVNGSIQIWNVKAGWGSRPDIYIEKAHEDGEDVTGLRFSADGHTLLSRSTDNTLKVWDLRQTSKPLKVFPGLLNSYAQTNAAFSPDERFILTGTSVEREGKSGGLLYFFHKERLELVRRVGISATESAVYCVWHPRLNQIIITTGDKKGGGTHILYDPGLSERGALVCVARAPRQKSAEDFEARPVIHNPHALPLFRDEPSRKRQREKARSDPLKSRRPDLPVTGPGFGGRVGSTKGSLLTQYLLKEGGLIKETWMDEDPREAILKYADAAAKDPKFIAPAYAKTQPETIFAGSDSEEEDK